jgi:hypothetical protein
MFGYNGRAWDYSFEAKDRFEFDVPAPRDGCGTFKDELIRAAKSIADLFPGEEILVMNGGGMDSEAMLWGFERAEVPHRSVCIGDENGANAKEMFLLPSNTEMFWIDMKAWLTSKECKAIAWQAQQSYCSLMYFAHTLLNQLRGRVVVMGFTEPELEGNVLTEYEWFYGTWKLFFNHGILGVPLFWSSFPSLYYAYVRELLLHGSKQRMYSAELGLRSRPKVNWHQQIQFWKPQGIWRRGLTIRPHDLMARIELGVA